MIIQLEEMHSLFMLVQLEGLQDIFEVVLSQGSSVGQPHGHQLI